MRFDRRRPRVAPEGGPHRKRAPALAVLRRAAGRQARVASDPDRRVRLLHRSGQHAISDCLVARSVPRDAISRPGAFHREQRVVGQRVAVLEVRSQRAVLRLEVARGDAEDHPAAGDCIQARDGLRRQEGVAVRKHQDVGVQAQPLRRRGGDGEAHERVEGVVAARSQPGVRRERMLGCVARVEIRVFQRARKSRRWPRAPIHSAPFVTWSVGSCPEKRIRGEASANLLGSRARTPSGTRHRRRAGPGRCPPSCRSSNGCPGRCGSGRSPPRLPKET